jgi:formylglycine-generating enzyme required for sulfatase activity/uncharacterized caspase-like protein
MTEKRRALIVASDEYQDPNLRQLVTPAQDAEDLALVLRDPAIGGFDQVETSINRPSHDVRRAIARFFAQGTRKDLLFLYFSGHGLLDAQGHLYLAAQDTERDLLSATAIPAAFVSAEMDRSRSRRQVLVLDCCHSGAFDRGAKGAIGARVGTAAAFEGTGYGRVVLTATDSTQYAWEGDQVIGQADHSVFTHYLVHGLQTGEADINADGLITLDELYDYVYAQVVRETPRQTPGKWTYKQQGEILIARNPALAASASLLPGWITEALASGAFSARLAAVGELTQLSQGRDRDLAAVARVELKRLSREDEHPAVRGAAAGVLGTAPISVQTPRDAPPPRAPQITPRKTEPTRPQPETAQYKTLSSDRISWKKDGKEMVRVPAGKFLYGYKEKEPDLPEFWIDKTPVTNAEYARFVAATDETPEHWKGKTPPKKIADHPVVYVSWHDAVAYAEWAGKRLPTEEEWEKSARGFDGREYPWGNQQPTSELCNFDRNVGSTTSVGKYSPGGDSPYGCVDMAGNVWEWTASEWEEGSARKVLHGGSFNSSWGNVRAADRLYRYPGHRGDSFGFRCVDVAPGQ